MEHSVEQLLKLGEGDRGVKHEQRKRRLPKGADSSPVDLLRSWPTTMTA